MTSHGWNVWVAVSHDIDSTGYDSAAVEGRSVEGVEEGWFRRILPRVHTHPRVALVRCLS